MGAPPCAILPCWFPCYFRLNSQVMAFWLASSSSSRPLTHATQIICEPMGTSIPEQNHFGYNCGIESKSPSKKKQWAQFLAPFNTAIIPKGIFRWLKKWFCWWSLNGESWFMSSSSNHHWDSPGPASGKSRKFGIRLGIMRCWRIFWENRRLCAEAKCPYLYLLYDNWWRSWLISSVNDTFFSYHHEWMGFLIAFSWWRRCQQLRPASSIALAHGNRKLSRIEIWICHCFFQRSR